MPEALSIDAFVALRPLPGPGLGLAVLAPEPRECPRCHRMTIFFVNRWGRTASCFDCDAAEENS